MNLRHYGRAETVEVSSASFQHAYGALSRIIPDHWQRFVVLSQDASRRAYGVSPAAHALQPTLDGPLGDQWRQVACHENGTSDCPEILSSWFQWAPARRRRRGRAVWVRRCGRTLLRPPRRRDRRRLRAACDRPALPPRRRCCRRSLGLRAGCAAHGAGAGGEAAAAGRRHDGAVAQHRAGGSARRVRGQRGPGLSRPGDHQRDARLAVRGGGAPAWRCARPR